MLAIQMFTVRFFQLLQMCYNSYNKMLGNVYHYKIAFIFMRTSYFLKAHTLNKEKPNNPCD